MDQAEPQPLPGQPEQPAPGAGQPDGAQPDGPQPCRPADMPARSTPADQQARRPADPGRRAEPGPRSEPLAGDGPLLELDHPVVVGYDGSRSSRHALAYAAGMARRLGRPLLLAYITSPSIFCATLRSEERPG